MTAGGQLDTVGPAPIVPQQTMHTETESQAESRKEPPGRAHWLSLKEFNAAGRGFWRDVSEADWNDWKWQLKPDARPLALRPLRQRCSRAWGRASLP